MERRLENDWVVRSVFQWARQRAKLTSEAGSVEPMDYSMADLMARSLVGAMATMIGRKWMV
jgi:hypothetical protein